MKLFLSIIILIIAIGGIFLLFQKNNVVEIDFAESGGYLRVPEAEQPTKPEPILINADIEPQEPLENPPKEIKAIYSTSWSASQPSKINYFINLIKTTELSAIIIDIKDYSGYIAYDIENAEVEKYKAKEIRIPQINKLIKRFHDEGIYIIARITIFQDPILAEARPDLAIHSFSSQGLWLDNKKLGWMDPASEEVWDYNIAIAKDIAERGFDEINFDYIRFASDGDLKDMNFPFWQNTRTNADLTRTNADNSRTKNEVIRDFFKYLRESLPDIKISADLFGLVTVNYDGLGIGQIIEDAYEYFDFVAPMIYPSHYAPGFIGLQNPAEYPYEVVRYSMDSALKRLMTHNQRLTTDITTSTESSVVSRKSLVKLRPWLQDFDLGADYGAEKVRAQIDAVYDSASSTPELINGFMLWDPRNVYTREALNENE